MNKGPSDNRTAAPLALPNKRAVVFAAKICTECAFKVSCPMADCLISASSVLQQKNKKKNVCKREIAILRSRSFYLWANALAGFLDLDNVIIKGAKIRSNCVLKSDAWRALETTAACNARCPIYLILKIYKVYMSNQIHELDLFYDDFTVILRCRFPCLCRNRILQTLSRGIHNPWSIPRQRPK